MAQAKKTPSATQVGKQFMDRYYNRLEQEPKTMGKFYKEQSSLIYGEDASKAEAVVGIDAIQDKLTKRSEEGWEHSFENLDAQSSHDGGVFLMVTGTRTLKEATQTFAQSFFLSRETPGISYYVWNDIFRVVSGSGGAAPVVAAPSAAPAPVRVAAAPPAKPAAAPAAAAAKPPAAKVKPAPAAAPAPPPAAPAPADPPAVPPPAPAPVEPEEPKKPMSWANMAAKAAPTPAAAAPRPVPAAKKPRTPPTVVNGEPAAEPALATPAPATTDAAAADEPVSGGRPGGGKASQGKNIAAEDMPSSAIFVKNLEPTVTDDVLKDVFLPYMVGDKDKEKMLIANTGYARGYAFVDLGSQEAVARAVSAGRSSEGVKCGGKRLTVEPSKKPVRPSGLKAMTDRRPSSSSSAAGAAAASAAPASAAKPAATAGGKGGKGRNAGKGSKTPK